MNIKPPKISLILLLLLITFPYALAFIIGAGEDQFLGFLLNPIDGLSYLAKMQQGRQGNWLFTLPYTAELENGSFLFGFYLLLGHVSRLISLQNILVFHIARIFSSMYLVYVLWQFLGLFYRSNEYARKFAFILLTLGSGLGWLIFLTGLLPADFWIAEMYPFLSMYSNPHFPLGMGILLQIIILSKADRPLKPALKIMLLGCGLSIIMPFGMVIAGMVLGGGLLVRWVQTKKIGKLVPIIALIPGFGILLWQYWQTISNPILTQWNNQNLTPSPQWWDLLLALSPAIIFAMIGAVGRLRSDAPGESREILWIWLISGLILAYLPLTLQRRFLFGIFIPVGILAIDGIGYLSTRFSWLKRRGFQLLIGLSIPSNLILILVGLFGILSHSPKLFLSAAEKDAIIWIRENTEISNVFASSQDMGMVIPALTGRRVIYGHPFETPQFENTGQILGVFYSNPQTISSMEQFAQDQKVDYFICGKREKIEWEIRDCFDQAGQIIYQNSEIEVITPIHEN